MVDGTHDMLSCAIRPNEIIFMTLPKAAKHKFLGQFGSAFAYEELLNFGKCSKIRRDWVDNHWTLIVWKLAGIAKAKPREWQDWWDFGKVCEQLKYRYEREYILAERSCIKRIQERDSGPGGPMTLVVSQIFFEQRQIAPQPGAPEGEEPVLAPVACGLELSDGWYRIKANLDDVLYRAEFFGRLRSGTKIQIQGARLEGSTDGAEPLEAYDSSSLTISGNSTARASWYAKLGFQKKRPIVSTFRSLLPDGGLVPYIDVIITKTFPLGFKGEWVEGASQDVWNESEERERQRDWEVRSNPLRDQPFRLSRCATERTAESMHRRHGGTESRACEVRRDHDTSARSSIPRKTRRKRRSEAGEQRCDEPERFQRCLQLARIRPLETCASAEGHLI